MGFFIECTIAEIETKNNALILKIRGTDGFVLCQGSRTYNVFFPKDLGKPKNLPDVIGPSAMVLDAESIVVLRDQSCHCLSSCISYGHKLKIKFETCEYSRDCDAYELKKNDIIFING